MEKYDLIIVGAGPAGIFTAVELLRHGSKKKMLLVEKGKPVEKRHCPKAEVGHCVNCRPTCAITTGFSGAGAFSDGKLSLSYEVGGDLPALIGEEFAQKLIDYTDKIYLEFGADPHVEGIYTGEEIKEIRKNAIHAGLKLVDCPIRHLGTEKAQQLGARVVALSDSNGYIYDKDGIKLDIVKDIKEVRRGRIKEYVDAVPTAVYTEGKGIWSIPCDIALPCATQNELNLDDAKALKANGCFAVAEGANMPSTREATDFFQENGMMFMPGKAANAGGVATSALEMSQNSLRLSWSFEEVDEKLHGIMVGIYAKAADAAERYGVKGNYVAGANIAGFEKVVEAMMAQGVV